jgi:uncharacterized membrane protein
MEEQSSKNHAKLVPAYHFVLSLLLLLTLIGSLVNLYYSWSDPERLYSAALIVAIVVALFIIFALVRVFPLKAQDRAIRAEESLRYFILTGKRLDPRLTIRQIIGLRFASDGEFAQLAQKAADENLSSKAIKQMVKSWRPDHDRL